MNIKELAEQAGLSEWRYEYAEKEFERFAELIRLDETKAGAKHYLEIMRDAVEAARLEEREACAQIADPIETDEHMSDHEKHAYDLRDVIAQDIRKRGAA